MALPTAKALPLFVRLGGWCDKQQELPFTSSTRGANSEHVMDGKWNSMVLFQRCMLKELDI